MEELRNNLIKVRSRIAAACQACGRPMEAVELLAVTKTHSSERIRALYECGLRRFGENYTQEMLAKANELRDLDLEWVFIGQIQSNKLRKIVAVASEIQTVASLKHAQAIATYAEEFAKKNYPIYLSVNAGNESSKGGLVMDDVVGLAREIANSLPILRIKGIMAIPPLAAATCNRTDAIPTLYSQLAQLASLVGEGQLSLGMSNDLEMAIAAGSTCVRIGTDLLGQRSLRK